MVLGQHKVIKQGRQEACPHQSKLRSRIWNYKPLDVPLAISAESGVHQICNVGTTSTHVHGSKERDADGFDFKHRVVSLGRSVFHELGVGAAILWMTLTHPARFLNLLENCAKAGARTSAV